MSCFLVSLVFFFVYFLKIFFILKSFWPYKMAISFLGQIPQDMDKESMAPKA